jgi:hypothetical protein
MTKKRVIIMNKTRVLVLQEAPKLTNLFSSARTLDVTSFSLSAIATSAGGFVINDESAHDHSAGYSVSSAGDIRLTYV